jgi:hypothetical protein
MRISKRVPKDFEQLFVEVNNADKMFKWYNMEATEIGSLQYSGVRHWVSDDGLEFVSPDAALEYFNRRTRTAPQVIKPGEYDLPVTAVLQQGPRLVLRLEDGSEVVINTKR